MAHEFESGFFAGNRPAWHGLGRVIDKEGLHSGEALDLAGLAWEVRTEPVVWNDEHVLDQFFTVRSSDQRALGIVGPSYTPIQNAELFEFGDALVDSGDAHWYTGGSLRRGSLVWALMKLSKDIKIGGMEDERMERYLAFMSSHDGSMAFNIKPTTVRIVCANTFGMVKRERRQAYTVRHTRSRDEKLAEVRAALQLSFEQADDLQKMGDALLGVEFNDRQFAAMLDVVTPKPEDTDSTRAMNAWTERRDGYIHTWQHSPNLENVRATAWGGLNAIIEYDDHHTQYTRRGTTPVFEKRMLRILDGHPTTKRAIEYCADLVSV